MCAGRSLSSDHGSVVGVDAQHELPGRHQHGVGRQRPARRQRRPRAEQRLAVAQLVGGEHRLDVLLLVLLDHHVGEQAAPASSSARRGRRSTRPRTSAMKVRASRGVSSGRLDPRGARVLERVVQLLDLGRQQALRRRRCRRAAARGPPAGRCGRGPRPAGSSAGRAGWSARLVEVGQLQGAAARGLEAAATVSVRQAWASSSSTTSGPTASTRRRTSPLGVRPESNSSASASTSSLQRWRAAPGGDVEAAARRRAVRRVAAARTGPRSPSRRPPARTARRRGRRPRGRRPGSR